MRFMNGTLAWLLAAAMLITCLPAQALAAENENELSAEVPVLEEPVQEEDTADDIPAWDETEESPEERISGQTAEGNIYFEYADGILRIHGAGPMADYDAGRRPPWLENSSVWKRIRAVVIDEGITSIGDYAFIACNELRTVQLPEGLTRIGEAAFMGCENLVQIDLPEGVREIGQAAFFGCSNLLLIGLPASLERIGDVAFRRCEKLLYVYYGGAAEQMSSIDFGMDTASIRNIMYLGRIQRHTVTFDSQGGSPVPPASALRFNYAIRPVDPVRAGMRFDGWYREPECVRAFDFFEESVREDLTLYAKWISGESILVPGKFLPAELDALSVRTLLGEENYAACLETYGPEAVVQVGDAELGEYAVVSGGLESEGIPLLSGLFYIRSNKLWEENRPFTVELIVGKTASAMDTDSSRYTLSFDVYFLDEILKLSLAAEQADGMRTALEDFDWFPRWRTVDTSQGVFAYNEMAGTVYSPEFVRENKVLAGLSFQDGFDATGCELSVYDGWSDKLEIYLAHPEREITGRIWNQGDLTAGGGQLLENGDTAVSWYATFGIFSILLKRNGVTNIIHMQINASPADKLVSGKLYARMGKLELGKFTAQSSTEGLRTYTHKIAPLWEYTANSDLWLRLTFLNTAASVHGGQQGINFVRAAYVGRFSSEDEALQAGADNIKDMLFTEKGYRSNYSGEGVTFTIVDTEGELHHYRYVVEDAFPGTGSEKPVPGESDTYFRAYGACYGGPHSADFYMDDSSTYRIRSDDYYFNGYQSVFLLDGDGNGLPVGTDIYPEFAKGPSVTIYAGQHQVGEAITSGVEQHSGESRVTLTGPVTTVQYSAASENHVCLKNYWVSYVTRSSGGGKLFVNGATNAIDAHRDAEGNPRRVVVLDKAHAHTHEIFVANTGDAPLGVTVTLEDAVGVELDPHWTGTGTLPAFTNTWDNDETGRPDNSTMIHLVAQELPDGKRFYEGPISGKLTISADNGESVTIDLSGCAGSFDLITETMGDAVLYVPYDQAIQNTSTGHASAVTCRVTDGSLPDGLQMYPNGVIYGVPTAVGRYTFTVSAHLNNISLGLPDEQVEKEFTITVLENTDSNVWTRTDIDEDYDITIAIPNQDGSTSNINLGGQATATIGSNSWSDSTLLLETQGPYARFRNLYLDARRLTEGTDYTSDEGSTRITIRAQTLANSGKGRHTLAAEFYESRGEDGTMRKASQNFTITRSNGSGNADNTGSAGPGSGDPDGTSSSPRPSKPSNPSTSSKPSKPTTPSNQAPAKPAATDTGMPFTDVLSTNWFFNDVKWAVENQYMNGVSAKEFAPNTAVTQAMIVTILGRMAKVDPQQFSASSYPDIQGGKWYTEFAVWARQSGLLPAAADFAGGAPISRNDMAVMLVKYLRVMGKSLTAPAQPAAFADAEQMTREGRDAFQLLYANDIFKGVGGGRMDPAGSTTRAQFCTLLRRLSERS